ncbi:tRNA (adenosine(37)-N6)-dimethylallyltransferase MiaA [Candidatus Uabimicrobium sp. HlEnr_7]|uniref:tRNA (adenosine(37)-N6)-dimethylallyltransferase MiaA n=1 Tax=Candidatus Uabimicrobium helgolandensis TaxID=3095367 RepID=UPI003556B5CC
MNLNKFLYVLAGPTGSGKTGSSIKIAKALGAEIICIDSMSVYKNMDIGTAKVSIEDQKKVPHHLLDIIEPSEEFSVQKFLDKCVKTIENIFGRKKNVLLVVGTPLYFKALVKGMFESPQADEEFRKTLEKCESLELHQRLQSVDLEAAKRIAINDRKRVIRALEVFHLTGKPISVLQREETKPATYYPWKVCCLNWRRDLLYTRIEKRVDLMLEQGFIDETKRLLSMDYELSKTAAKAIGYKDIIDVLSGKNPCDSLSEIIKQNTRRYAKRQMTWWRSFEVSWIDLDENNGTEDHIVTQVLSQFGNIELRN